MRSCLLGAVLSILACGGPKPGREVAPTAPDRARGCHDAHDCAAGETCFAPDFAPHGRSACTSDDACRGIGEVCGLAGACVTPCAGPSCGPGYTCLDGGHCARVPCNAPGGVLCEASLTCNPSSGACERLACHADHDCGPAPAACWNGQCFEHGGACKPAAACCPP